MSAPGDLALGSLRIYFRRGAKLKADGLWAGCFAPALGQHLLKEAKRAGIRQALIHTVPGAHADGRPFPEAVGAGSPQCAELVDAPGKLEAFLKAQAPVLSSARAVLLRCEELRLGEGDEERLVKEVEDYFHGHPAGPGTDGPPD